MSGKWCELVPLVAGVHADELYRSFDEDAEGRCWTYMGYGPFADEADYRAWVSSVEGGTDPLFFAIRDKLTGRLGGVASYLRIAPELGSIEVGHIAFAPCLQRTRAGTEAMYLMMRHAFDLGYRRYEWKCDSLNEASRRAAERYGFQFEGIFRQALVYKGRNRDTAWLSLIDGEWPTARKRFERWLEPSNFDESGQQKSNL